MIIYHGSNVIVSVARRMKIRTHHAKNRKIPAEVENRRNFSAKPVQNEAKILKNIQDVIYF